APSTATKRPAAQVTASQILVLPAGSACRVQAAPSGEVNRCGPLPETPPRVTNRPASTPQATQAKSQEVACVWPVHVMPSGEVMIFVVLFSAATATHSPNAAEWARSV